LTARRQPEADNQRLIDKSRVVSGNKGFCTGLMNSHWRYLPLSESHTVTKDEASEFLALRGSGTDIDPHAGFFDINNDGKPEHLGRVSAYSGAGQGCDVEEFVEMNSERTHLVPSALTKLLEYKQCETYERAFLFDGKTYIENRRILSLNGGRRFLMFFRRYGSSKATRNDLSVTSLYEVTMNELPPV
jgi:hypothetical protein